MSHFKIWVFIYGLLLLNTAVYAVQQTPEKQPSNPVNNKLGEAKTLARTKHRDAGLHYYEAARNYSAANQPEQALTMINEAIKLTPNNVEYLKMRGNLGSWTGNLDVMYDSYSKVLQLQPNDQDALLGMARYYTWVDKLNVAKKAYKKYLQLYPNDKTAWIEYAKVLTWCEDYRVAFKILDKYKELFGPTQDYLATRAYVLALAGYGTEALAAVNPLLRKDPNNYDLNLTKALAQNAHNQPTEALQTVAFLSALRPDSLETKGVSDFIKTPLRSNINLGGSYFHDTDSVSIASGDLWGQYYLNPETSLLAGGQYQWLWADRGSGLETVDDDTNILASQVWGGIRHRFNPYFAVEAHAGGTFVGDGESYANYLFNADLQKDNKIFLRFQSQYDLYAVSPRAVSLGINQQRNGIILDYQPWTQTHILGDASYSIFSDGNEMWFVHLNPRTAVLRTGAFNLDLGIRGLLYGFEEDFDNGYYDPELYQYYAITADAYWGLTENIGFVLALDGGIQKDETYDHFEFGGNAAVEGYFGIYKDWMLVVGGYVSSLENASDRLGDDRYRSYEVRATLTRRF